MDEGGTQRDLSHFTQVQKLKTTWEWHDIWIVLVRFLKLSLRYDTANILNACQSKRRLKGPKRSPKYVLMPLGPKKDIVENFGPTLVFFPLLARKKRKKKRGYYMVPSCTCFVQLWQNTITTQLQCFLLQIMLKEWPYFSASDMFVNAGLLSFSEHIRNQYTASSKGETLAQTKLWNVLLTLVCLTISQSRTLCYFNFYNSFVVCSLYGLHLGNEDDIIITFSLCNIHDIV